MASHVTNILLIQYATSVTLTTNVCNFRNHYISPLNPTTQYFLSNFLLAFSKNTRKKKTEFRLPRSRGEEHGEGSEAPQGGGACSSPLLVLLYSLLTLILTGLPGYAASSVVSFFFLASSASCRLDDSGAFLAIKPKQSKPRTILILEF